jgi:ribosome biogenesis GTPase
MGWSAVLQTAWNELESRVSCVPARVAAIERGAAKVWVEAEGFGALEPHELEGVGVALASYGGALGARPIAEVLAVGDWVGLDRSLRIREIVPRRSSLVRRAVGSSAPQLVAANLDRVFIVTAVDRDFNPRRIERYLTAIYDGGADPEIVLNKADLEHDPDEIRAALDEVAPAVPVVFTSALGAEVTADFEGRIVAGETVAFVGSSGVGKSSLVNRLCGEEVQRIGEVRAVDHKGRHTTTKRELFVTPSRALLIDTPGMRELGLFDASDGLSSTFEDVEAIAASCRFTDCAHAGEPGCAIGRAIESGVLSRDRWDSYQRLAAELRYEARRADARVARDAKKHWKSRTKDMRERQKLERKLGLKGH